MFLRFCGTLQKVGKSRGLLRQEALTVGVPLVTSLVPPKELKRETRKKVLKKISGSMLRPSCSQLSTHRRRAGREAAPAGVSLGNTTPQSSQKPYYRGSLDTLHLACHVQHGKHWPKTFANLEAVRQTALKEHKRQRVKLAGREWWVLNAHPVNMGKAQAQVVLESNGVTLLVNDVAAYSKDQANLWLQFGSMPFLATTTYESALDLYAFSFLERLRVRRIRSSPQTVHYCLDAGDLPMSYFAEAKQNGCYTSRTKKRRAYEGDESGVETLYFGERPNSQGRLYDKLLECRLKWAKGGQEKFRNIVANRFDGVTPERITRIEWELNRDILRDKFAVNDWENDCTQKLGTIMEYMSHDFLRFTEEPVDRANNHQSRAKTSPEWEHVQNSLKANLEGRNLPIEKHKAEPMTCAEKYRNAWYYAMSGMAFEGFRTRDKGELLAYFEDKMLENLPADWADRLEEKNELADQRRFNHIDETTFPDEVEEDDEDDDASQVQTVICFE